MKTIQKFSKSVLLLMLLIFLTTACTKDNPLFDPYQNSYQNNNNNNNNNGNSNEETYTLADLQGTWLRSGGNHTGNIGMIIEVTGNEGVIVDPVDSGFQIDDVKWMNIVEQEATDFTYSELGSDYNYYSATIEFQSDDVFLIYVDAGGAGNYQEWTRQ